MRLVSCLVSAGLAGSLAWAAEPAVLKPDIEAVRRDVAARLRAAPVARVNFADASWREALEFWKQKCLESDLRINFAVQRGELDPLMTIRNENTNCLDLLDDICRQTGLEWTVSFLDGTNHWFIDVRPKKRIPPK